MADTKKITETKAQIFKRLGAARMNRVLSGLKGVEKLAGKAYEYTPEQSAKILAALDAGVKRVKDAFAGVKAKADGFDL
jgi:hypothetical protein